MTDDLKRKQLRNFKALATGLFLLMALIFVLTTVWMKCTDSHWLGYVHAFSEAAMVGALADWFAVTALFHYPLGLRIPHTNLIENSKERIGDNLGNFVVDNFLSPENIRPYISKLEVSRFAGEWLLRENNRQMLVDEIGVLFNDILGKLDDKEVVGFLSEKAGEMFDSLKLNELASNGLIYLLDRNEQQRVITELAGRIKNYVLENDDLIREKVSKQSFRLIPKFIDNKVADKITTGLADFFREVELNPAHQVRAEITKAAYAFADELKNPDAWKEEFAKIKDSFLNEDKLQDYAASIWASLKSTITEELTKEDSRVKTYVRNNLNDLAQKLINDEILQGKIDKWVRLNVYKYATRNAGKAGELISSTVGNWQGKDLSRKLELEVGKDLQFIRINGTVVGGLVGLVIYTLANFI